VGLLVGHHDPRVVVRHVSDHRGRLVAAVVEGEQDFAVFERFVDVVFRWDGPTQGRSP